MTEKFEKLAPEKQAAIRLPALKIFAEKGFKDASTNTMVAEAGISKGTLFYYFKNKKGLYYYLIDYSLEIIEKHYISQIDDSTSDFIQRLSNNAKIKYRYYQHYPQVNHFLSTVLFKELSTLPTTYQEKFQGLIEETSEKMSHNLKINEALFKENINPQEASQIIELSLEGYFSRLAEQFKYSPNPENNFDQQWQDFENYLENLRKVFYK